MSEIKKSWEKRLSSQTDKLAIDFVESISYDKRLYKYDIVGSIAHANMLADNKIITKAEFKQIKNALLEICGEIQDGVFEFDKTYEDIHMAVEAALVRKIGVAGKKLHTGRSRNDQVATDIRLWMRDQIKVMQEKIRMAQKAFLKLANKYSQNVMPSYTHMQRAQPIVIGAYLLSFVEMLDRDFKRLGNCSELLNVSPLGSGAIAGSTLNLDRKSTAKELEFDAVSRNSIDAVSDRDFCAEFIFDCCLISTHLSRLAEDWIIYSSNEFSFIKIADSFCTSSSMMPQKKNPDMLELIRGKTGSVYGSLMAMLTILKGLPSGYNRDLQEDKLHVFSASDTVEACLDMTAAIVNNTEFNIERIATGIEEGFLDATALAEYLVSKGVAFREAHGIVGALVSYCEKKAKWSLSELTIEELSQYSGAIDRDVYKYLGTANVTARYATEGAGGPSQVKKQLEYWKKLLD